MVHKIHRLVGRYINFVSGREKVALVITLVIFLIGVAISLNLELKSDLKALLPQNYESVKELDRVIERVGGVGSLIVVAEGPNVNANKKFMDDLAVKLGDLSPELIRYVSYKTDDIREYYEDHFLYYIDAPDLELIYSRLKKRIDYEKIKRTPLFLDLSEDGEEEAPPELAFNDIRDRNEKNYSAPLSTFDDYYGGEWGRMLIMVVRPQGATITIDSARKLVGAVEDRIAQMMPATYDPSMAVGLCGNVKSTIEEYDTLKSDVISTALLCILLIAGSIILYFLRVRVVFLLGATLCIAIAWTFALTEIFIGYLNAQTAFLGSIIVGTGINYGIIVMARYLEERKKQKAPAEAMGIAIETTARPTFLAAATTAVAFAVMFIARIKGLSQFGFIGAVGVMLCWLTTMLVLPIMTIESEKVLKLVRPRATPKRQSAVFEVMSKITSRSPFFVIVASVFAAAVAVSFIISFAPRSIEYDFTKMRNRVSVESGTEALEKRVSKLFKNSMTPSVVLVDSVEEGRAVCDAVMEQNNAMPLAEQRVGSCHSIYDLLPTDQEKKLPIIAKIGKLLTGEWVGKLKGDVKDKVERVKRSVIGRPIEVSDLPVSLTRHFDDLEGRRGAVVFINPRPGMLLSDGRNLLKFANTIRNIDLGDGKVVHAVSEAIIFSDLIEIIKKEAPYLTFAALLGVILFVLFTLKKMKASFVIIMGLVWAVIVMVGIAAFMDIKINFFNFIVLPLTFGIGVDYGINMVSRIKEEGVTSVAHAIRHTGGAVILCSITTIIGYWVLTRAANQALATFGVAAVIGEFTCIFAAIVLVPAVIVFTHNLKERNKNE